MGTSTADSGMTFSPSQNGTSLNLQAGLEARVRENTTLSVQAGYAHSISDNSAGGHNGQATLNMTSRQNHRLSVVPVIMTGTRTGATDPQRHIRWYQQ